MSVVSSASSAPRSDVTSAEEMIAALIGLYKPAVRRRQRTPTVVPASQPAPRNRQRCRCGSCSECAEDARWERIFNEKFAWPEYYRSRDLENWSTLSRK